MLAQLIINGVVAGCAYALLAMGFGLIYSTTRVFHFAHGAVYTLTAYIFFTLFTQTGWPLSLAALTALAAAAFAGMGIEEVIYRPLMARKSTPPIMLLSSVAAYTVIVNLIAMIYSSETKVISPGVQPTYSLGSVIITRMQLATLAAFVLTFVPLHQFLLKTGFGRTMRAARDSPDLIAALGFNHRTIRLVAFALGSVISGVGAVLASLDSAIDPNVGMMAVFSAAVAVIVGGVGRLKGAVVGAFLLGLIKSLIVWKFSGQWVEGIASAILILFLLFRPEGITGHRRRAEEVVV